MFDNKFGTHSNVECGLVCIKRLPENHRRPERVTPIPLIAVDVKASVVHAAAEVELTQVYVNKEDQPIEAIYYFPVDSNGGVTQFRAELEGKTITGVVKPQEEAKAQYDKAVQERNSAFLVESDKPDIFKVRIGYLKPGNQVKIVIGYVTEVKNEKGSNAIRFFIPTTISPRYIPDSDTDEKSMDLKNMTFSATTPAPLTINVNVAIQGGIKSVESPSHGVTVAQGPVLGKETWTRAVVNLTGKTTDMDRDFVLNIVPKEVHAPRLYKEILNDSTVILAHLIPSFNLDEQKVELVFVLDRSGSMQGQSIALAKKALQLFLHSLPVDCYFNVVGFGSSFQFLFPESVKYDDGNLKKALALCDRLDADLGGTEILQPLREVFKRTAIDGYLRQVFVITDGEVSNTEQVIGFISANSHVSRVFALGIGDGASHELVEGVASAGGGTAAFATYEESIDAKVLHQLKNAIQPSLTNVSITWEGLHSSAAAPAPPVEINKEKTLMGYGKPINVPVTPDASPIQVPEKIPPIFDGSQLLVFGIFSTSFPTGVTITAESPDGPLSLNMKLDGEGEANLELGTAGTTGILHSLAAVKTIRDLQLKILRTTYDDRGNKAESEAVKVLKDQVISTSCKYGVASKYTSFVAVDSNSQASDENWVMQTRYVPSQLSHGWHGAYNSFGGGIRLGAARNSCAPANVFGWENQCNSGGRSKKLLLSGVKGGGVKLCGKSKSSKMAPPSTTFGFSTRSTVTSDALDTGEFGATFGGGSGIGASAAVQYCLGGGGTAAMDMEEEEFEQYKPAGVEKKAKLTEEDRMHLLVKVQSFDGSFNLDQNFCSVTRANLDTLKGYAKANGWIEAAYATAVALCYFTEKFASLKDSWELVALKARKWLQKNAGPTMDAMIASATQYIQSL